MRYVIQAAEDVLPCFLWFHPCLRLVLICWLQKKYFGETSSEKQLEILLFNRFSQTMELKVKHTHFL